MTLPREPRIHPVPIAALRSTQRRLPRDTFWIYLDNRGWLHPFDARGYAKDTTPFSEFLWADLTPGWCGPIANDEQARRN